MLRVLNQNHGLHSNGENEMLQQFKKPKFSNFICEIFNAHIFVSGNNDTVNNFKEHLTYK